MLSDSIESHSPVFFSAGLRFVFQLKCMQKKLGGTFCSLLLNDKQKKCFVFPNNEISAASCSRLFFCIRFYLKMMCKPGKKIQGCDFLSNWRPHAKIQLIWTKKKKQTKIRHRMVMLRHLQLLVERKVGQR